MAIETPLRRRGQDARRGLRSPLSRKPKQLDEKPTLHELSKGAGSVLFGDGKSSKAKPIPAGVSAPGNTEEEAKLLTSDQARERDKLVDGGVWALARQISERLAVNRPRPSTPALHGAGRLLSAPYGGFSDELDLDRTLDALVEHPVPSDNDLFVREWLRLKRSVVLLLDVSGSMRGERIRTAAATVGALSAELRHDELAVVAFWSDAAVLLELGEPVRPAQLLETILQLPARGLTNVAFPLEVAAMQLAKAGSIRQRVLLLSDCVHNAGPDPRPLAARLPRLDVLLDASGEKDVDLGRQLAAAGKGLCKVVRDFRGVAPALGEIFFEDRK